MGETEEEPSGKVSRRIPAAIIKQALAAKEVREIKKDILRNGFQPVSQHFAGMGLSRDEQMQIPSHLRATKLGRVYNPQVLCEVIVEFLEPALLYKDIGLQDTGSQPVTRNGGQWIIMHSYFADELMKNLKSGRTVSSDSMPSLQ